MNDARMKRRGVGSVPEARFDASKPCGVDGAARGVIAHRWTRSRQTFAFHYTTPDNATYDWLSDHGATTPAICKRAESGRHKQDPARGRRGFHERG